MAFRAWLDEKFATCRPWSGTAATTSKREREPMAVTSYHTVDGQILGQTASGTRTQYLTDALGSVTCTVADDGSTQNTYRYKPYGATLANTGGSADPHFLWSGAWGYRAINLALPKYYVRSRHYDTRSGSWLSSDLYWPDQPAYDYARKRPLNLTDPTGAWPCDMNVWPTLDCRDVEYLMDDGAKACGLCYGVTWCKCDGMSSPAFVLTGELTANPPMQGLPCAYETPRYGCSAPDFHGNDPCQRNCRLLCSGQWPDCVRDLTFVKYKTFHWTVVDTVGKKHKLTLNAKIEIDERLSAKGKYCDR